MKYASGPSYINDFFKLKTVKCNLTLSLQEWPISNFSCSLTRNITSHSMKNLASHSLLRWKMIVPPNLTTLLIHFSLKGWENVRCELRSGRVKKRKYRKWRFVQPDFKYEWMHRSFGGGGGRCLTFWPCTIKSSVLIAPKRLKRDSLSHPFQVHWCCIVELQNVIYFLLSSSHS